MFRLIIHGVLPGIRHMGDGRYVTSTLSGLGYKVDTTPAVHSVMSTAATSHPALGHTAMVAQVNSDGSIVVEEYNYAKPLKYSTRVISAKQIKDDNMTFAHTEVDYK
jgi:surface antigen